MWLTDSAFCHVSAIFFIFIENGFDPHNRIKDIWTSISLKGSEFVQIKNIILGCLIGKVSIF